MMASHLHVKSTPFSGSGKSLKSSISLNMDVVTEPLSPIGYQFLLRRSSAVIEEQVEVSAMDILAMLLMGVKCYGTGFYMQIAI